MLLIIYSLTVAMFILFTLVDYNPLLIDSLLPLRNSTRDIISNTSCLNSKSSSILFWAVMSHILHILEKYPLRNKLNKLELEFAVFILDILPLGDWIGDISLFLLRLIADSLYPLLSERCLGAFIYCKASIRINAVEFPFRI